MKNRICWLRLTGGMGAILLSLSSGNAQTSIPTSAAQAPAPPPAAQTVTPAKLPFGVEDVLKLSRARISEDIILNYVQNSGTVYNLAPTEIVYLRNEGVSDRVVSAMLDQRKKVAAEMAAQAATQLPAPTAPPPYPAYPDYADTSSAPPPAYYAEPQPEPQPAPSTVYVIPYAPVRNAYYGYTSYPAYYTPPYYLYNSYGYYGPSLSFGFRFGGGGHSGAHVGTQFGAHFGTPVHGGFHR